MKRTISLLLATVLLIAVFAVFPAAAEPKAEDVVILYTNDIHCGVDTDIGCDGLKLYLREMKAQYENVLTVDVGDAIQGMPVGTLSKGEDVITVMNEVGYDAAAVGNHEFDYTVPELMKRASELNCGYLCCYFFDKRTGECVFKPYEIFDVAGKKIAFITPNYLTRTFHSIVSKSNLPQIRLHDLRHSVASNLLASGIPVVDVQEWLGHANASTTLDVYSHAAKSSKDKIAKALQAMITVA